MSTKSNWTAVTESKYPWERDALDFVRAKFPTYEPYRAWANFEFIADDGGLRHHDSSRAHGHLAAPDRRVVGGGGI